MGGKGVGRQKLNNTTNRSETMKANRTKNRFFCKQFVVINYLTPSGGVATHSGQVLDTQWRDDYWQCLVRNLGGKSRWCSEDCLVAVR